MKTLDTDLLEEMTRLVDEFQPEQIILFGSHAYGTPHPDSDVDILVVMPARNEVSQASRIRLARTSTIRIGHLVLCDPL